MVKIAIGIPVVALADPDENARRIVALIGRAAAAGATEIHLPPSPFTGVTCGDLALQPLLREAAAQATSQVRAKAQELGVELYFGTGTYATLGSYERLTEELRTKSLATEEPVVYVSPGFGESTTDYVFAGDGLIFQNGKLLAASERFSLEEQLVFAGSVNSKPQKSFSEVLQMQSVALATRLTHTGISKAVIGISGGLDSTWALLATVHTFDRLKIPRRNIIALTMPGFGTGGRTYANALKLMQLLGVTAREISITKACEQHFSDIGCSDKIVFENAQARMRTLILMDVANAENALVIGTGDLSELALGWCTYNGDQMSMYGLNASLPKTLIQRLTREYADAAAQNLREVLLDIVATPISPELLAENQHTENIVGPYELHDLFLEGFMLRRATPAELLDEALKTFPEKYDRTAILKWMRIFFTRFFASQFKRSALPDGPKITDVSLSPRCGGWAMPSDASPDLWIKEIELL